MLKFLKQKGGENIRKQTILLVTTIVFALLLCGAVSAEDSQGGVDTDQVKLNDSALDLDVVSNSNNNNSTAQPVDPEITLNVTLEHPEALSGDKLPSITVTDNNGNIINALNISKTGNNQYKIKFLSDKTSFNLNVSAWGHVPQSMNVHVFSRTPGDPTLYGDLSVSLRAYNLLILSDPSSYAQSLVDAYTKLRDKGYYFNLNFFSYNEIRSDNETMKNKIKQAASKADIIILDMIGADVSSEVKELIAESAAKVFALRCTVFANDPSIDSNGTELGNYLQVAGMENMARFQLKSLQKVGMPIMPSEELGIVSWPTEFIFHPDSEEPLYNTWEDYLNWYTQTGRFKQNSPWVGMIIQASMFMNGNSQIHEQILRGLEEKGLNVIMVVTAIGGATGNTARVNAINKYFMNGNESRISALVACFGWNLVQSYPEQGIELFKKLNVPVFAPIYAYSSTLEEWRQDPAGLSNEAYWMIAMPEMEGRIEPIMMGGAESAETDPTTGITIQRIVPLPDRIDRIVNRVVNWIKLQTLPNEVKKVALIYYNHDGGKDGVSAFYLNVPESISEILTALKNNGYTVPEGYSVESIINLFLTEGNNVGSWAPGELKKVVDAGAITIPLETYLAWFDNLPETLKNQVIAEWGPALGNIMVYNGSIVIPGIMLGNIFVGPQPMRGWGENPSKIAHSTTLPPSHQYIAFYMWMQYQFQANAVIHLGTHGTLEWLPGKSVGLGEDDWPDVLLGNIPHIYPYIVDNPGEGTQAKRRSYAVIIDHMTAPLISSGIYGDLSTLNDLINSYDTTDLPARKTILENQIRELIIKLHLDEDMCINMDTMAFEDIKNSAEHKLEAIATTIMPYGLHTFGAVMNGTILDQMVESIVSFDPDNRDNPEFRAMIRQKLSQNYELQNLLAALRGEFISPGLSGDPIRKPDVLPTGMNFYTFDPRTAPDKTAWEIGKKMADDLLADFYQKNGHYPETVGVVLWDIETMRTNGQTISMILRYIGAEPDWDDKTGRVKGVKITPLSKLPHPRVDVLVTISGCFRDTFSYVKENVLEKAFQMVANLTESSDDNYVRKHYQEYLNKFIESGMDSASADALAKVRIFGPPPGTYVSALQNLVPSTTGWKDQSDLVGAYLNQMSYAYGTGIYGASGLDFFKDQLKHVEATVQVIDNSWGILDNDDVYSFLGGLTMTAKSLYGHEVSSYIANTRMTPKIETLNQFLSNEFRTRIMNLKWAEGMLNEGFSGANEIANEIGYLFAWNAVAPDAVKDWMWQAAVETYIFDPAMRSKFLKANPYAFASAAAWAIEASRRGLWNPDAATLTQLKDIYMQVTKDYGVVCCHHTCGNLDFNNYVVVGSSLSMEQIQQFANIMQAATGKTVTVGSTGAQSQPAGSVSSAGASSVGDEPASADSKGDQSSSTSQSTSESAGAEGTSKSYEVSEKSSSSSPQSNMPIVAIVGALIMVGLVGFGYFRGAIFKK